MFSENGCSEPRGLETSLKLETELTDISYLPNSFNAIYLESNADHTKIVETPDNDKTGPFRIDRSGRYEIGKGHSFGFYQDSTDEFYKNTEEQNQIFDRGHTKITNLELIAAGRNYAYEFDKEHHDSNTKKDHGIHCSNILVGNWLQDTFKTNWAEKATDTHEVSKMDSVVDKVDGTEFLLQEKSKPSQTVLECWKSESEVKGEKLLYEHIFWLVTF